MEIGADYLINTNYTDDDYGITNYFAHFWRSHRLSCMGDIDDPNVMRNGDIPSKPLVERLFFAF